MRTDDFIQSYSDGIVTVEREIHVMRLRIDADRRMLAHYLHHQPRDRHFRGLPECPDVIRYADKIEAWECRIIELERRKRARDAVQRRAA